MFRALVTTAISMTLVLGCASLPPAQVGQTAGTIAGAAIVPGVGAPFGALVGLLAGMLVQGQMDKATEKRERQTLGEQMQSIARSGTEESISAVAGEPKRVWVDETVEKGRVIAGYFDVRNIQ